MNREIKPFKESKNLSGGANLDLEKLVDETTASEQILPMSKWWFRKKRVEGGGPQFLKIGRRVFYRVGDLLEWAAQHERRSTSEG